MYWPWIELGLSGPSDLETVKHAYARRLKEVHPEEDPEGFQRLHRAYTAARRLAALMERGELAGDLADLARTRKAHRRKNYPASRRQPNPLSQKTSGTSRSF